MKWEQWGSAVRYLGTDCSRDGSTTGSCDPEGPGIHPTKVLTLVLLGSRF